MKSRWIDGRIETVAGHVARVDTRWTWRDRLGAMAVRWGIGRGRYTMDPGLYAVGQPAPGSPLLVTANYKLSFDHLRRAIDGLDAWILVLDTKGINVWCAAGKGTFGTAELVHRLTEVKAAQLVTHATLVLPQLAGPGVAAHEVRKQSGFRVVYGPVRAEDLPVFLRDGLRASGAMRKVTFTLRERLAVVPVEVVQRFIPALLIMLALFLTAGAGRNGYRFDVTQWPGVAVGVWTNFFAGVVLVPVLLPVLPGRSFAVKGAVMGIVTGTVLWRGASYGLVEGAGVLLLSAAACSFLGLMFTGCTPYTSPSGVRREMPWALRLQIPAAVVGVMLWFTGRFA